MGIIKQREEDASRALLVLKGEIDMHTSNSLRLDLLALVKKKLPRLELDMAEVSYIDSSGLATLIESVKACHTYGGVMRLRRVQKRVMDVFRLAHLETFFELDA